MKLKIITISIFLILIFSACYKIDTKQKPRFDRSDIELIMNADDKSPMRVCKINNSKDSIILRTKCDDVVPDSNDRVLSRLINRMYATVRDSINDGVGIAAPQIGILKNVIWVQRFDKEGEPFEYYLNPKILQHSILPQTRREGCLSIPDRSDTLYIRAYSILIEYTNMKNKKIIEMVEGFTAIIFQHEIDHLNGILYTDYVGMMPKKTMNSN